MPPPARRRRRCPRRSARPGSRKRRRQGEPCRGRGARRPGASVPAPRTSLAAGAPASRSASAGKAASRASKSPRSPPRPSPLASSRATPIKSSPTTAAHVRLGVRRPGAPRPGPSTARSGSDRRSPYRGVPACRHAKAHRATPRRHRAAAVCRQPRGRTRETCPRCCHAQGSGGASSAARRRPPGSGPRRRPRARAMGAPRKDVTRTRQHQECRGPSPGTSGRRAAPVRRTPSPSPCLESARRPGGARPGSGCRAADGRPV